MNPLALRDPAPDHVAELTLRRLRAGELSQHDSARLQARVAADPALRARLDALAAEEREFAATLPLERFAGGVERARRERQRARRQALRARALAGGLGLAAAAALALLALPRPHGGPETVAVQGPAGADDPTAPGATGRRKGGAGALTILVRIAARDGSQRTATAFERLAPGERLRLGYTLAAEGAPAAPSLYALTVDARGELSWLYPDPSAPAGRAPALSAAAAPVFLPDAFELTGGGATPAARRERLLVVVRATPLDPEAARARVAAAYAAARGDLAALVLPADPDPAAAELVQSFLFEKPPGD